jgi:hypothetical protein
MSTLREQLEAAMGEVASDDTENSELQEQVESSADDAQTDLVDQSETTDAETHQEIEEQLEAPQFWSSEYKERFGKAITDKDVQKYIIEREKQVQSEFTRARQEAARLQKELEGTTGIYEPFRDAIEASGMTPTQYTQALMLANERLMRDPVNGLRQMAEALGVTPETLLSQQQQQPTDPRYAELQQQVVNLHRWQQEQEQTRQRQQYESLVSEVDSAIKATDEAGNPKFQFIEREDVLAETAALVQTYKNIMPTAPVRDLVEKAYRKAIADNDEIQKLISQSRAKQEQSKQAQKVRSAKLASKSITSNVSDVEQSLEGLSTREMLMRAAEAKGY